MKTPLRRRHGGGALQVALLLAVGFSFLGSSLHARKNARVFVDSFAKEEYVEAKQGEEGPRMETYHFFKGRYFGGNIRDNSLNEVKFEDVVETLAMEMRTRNYYPAKLPEQGDFLIVIHWGVTAIEEPLDELMQNEPGSQGEGEFNSETGEFMDTFTVTNDFDSMNSSFPSRSKRENAELTGFNRALRRKGLTVQDEYELRDMLDSERYFIVLMAYDWQKLRTEGAYELVWSTRFSLDAIGTNFVDAHFALSRGAANYFGTNLDGKLGKTTTHLGPGDVELGDLEVIETVGDEKADAKE